MSWWKNVQHQLHLPSVAVFDHAEARDDRLNIPTKKDPAAMHFIAKDILGMDMPSSQILKLGNSYDNGIIFGTSVCDVEGNTKGEVRTMLAHCLHLAQPYQLPQNYQS
jgi:hypothetical protein